MSSIKFPLTVTATLLVVSALSGCQTTLYYNPRFLDAETANVNFQQDSMRSVSYTHLTLPTTPYV